MSFSVLPCILVRPGLHFGRAVLTNVENGARNPLRPRIKIQSRENLGGTAPTHRSASNLSAGSESAVAGNGLLFRQMSDKESWTYTYLLADSESKEAVIIDPVVDQVERDLKIIEVSEKGGGGGGRLTVGKKFLVRIIILSSRFMSICQQAKVKYNACLCNYVTRSAIFW